MRFARPGRGRRRPGLTPLIDVVFLLLVFFMLASRFETESLLPVAVRVTEPARAEESPAALRVDLDAAGRARVAGSRLDAPSLQRALAGAVAEARSVRVRPAPETPLQPIVELLVQARDAGARDVALLRDAAGSGDRPEGER